MAGNAYVDSSALLKLAFPDAYTPALEADLSARDGLLSSRLTAIECGRTLRRETRRKPLYTLEDLLEGVVLLEITPAIGERASDVPPPVLRSLDAIHLATALSLEDPSLELITYDHRLADAARAHGLTVVQPGVTQA
ncbi:MAG: type II toxin-antitoxin system VapC family toxin [Vicinamibacterales bacterium]